MLPLVTFTYDDNGNRLTETRTRTKSDGTAETLVTTWKRSRSSAGQRSI